MFLQFSSLFVSFLLICIKCFQIQRALKHAVNASLLKFQNGRYKAQLILKPTRAQAKPTSENFEELLPDNFYDQEGEENGLTAKLRDRPRFVIAKHLTDKYKLVLTKYK